MATPRVVLVTRRTEYDDLLARHATRGQVEFFLRSRGQDIATVLERHERTLQARRDVVSTVPMEWRQASVERDELARFVFEPTDIVVVLGQDGLVANVAKYLDGQPVVGVDPLPGTNAGILVPFVPSSAADVLAGIDTGRAAYRSRTMVRVSTDDGQTLDALNEIYLGQPGHQSARYTLISGAESERQSSSGVIVGTGTGATGWCASLQRVMAPATPLPHPEDRELAWFVREAWPSRTTGTTRVAGQLAEGESLSLRCESEELVAFGDGIESDRLLVGWGQRVTVSLSPRVLRTVQRQQR